MRPNRKVRYRTGDQAVDNAVDQLVDTLGPVPNNDILAELLSACCRLAMDGSDRGDLKLASSTVRQLRGLFLAFAPYRAVRKVTVFGSARVTSDSPLYAYTADLARSFAAADWMVVSGAGPGTMAACIEGAGADSSLGVAIELPWETEPTPLITGDPKLVLARHFFIRKLGLVKESHAFVCMPGGFGTLDEMFEVLTLMTRGKGQISPIYLVDPPEEAFWADLLSYFHDYLVSARYVDEGEIGVLKHLSSIDEVVADAVGFYRNYHSMRYIGDDLLLRVRMDPSETLMLEIEESFDDILTAGVPPTRLSPQPDSKLLPEGLFGIRLRFNRYSFSRLYALVDFLNSSG